MKNLKEKLDRLFWDYEEKTTYLDKINLVCSFKEHIDNMDDLELAEKLEIDADDPDFDIEILNARQTVSNGCDKLLEKQRRKQWEFLKTWTRQLRNFLPPRMISSKQKKTRGTNNENAVNRHANGQAGSPLRGKLPSPCPQA